MDGFTMLVGMAVALGTRSRVADLVCQRGGLTDATGLLVHYGSSSSLVHLSNQLTN